jgi:D-alanyl-D-alanine dipeptidase
MVQAARPRQFRDTRPRRSTRCGYNGRVTPLLAAGLLLAAAPPAGNGLVDATDLVPDAVVDIRYARPDNVFGRALYPAARCLLLRPAAERLAGAAGRLRARGYRLRLLDCYRPLSVHQEMWNLRPRGGYVADPARGSNHSRGTAVDLTLVTLAGEEVEMPTAFDSFEPRAAADAEEGVSAAARRNRMALRQAMEEAGFVVHPREWWHFAARDSRLHPLLDVPLAASRP